MKSSNGKEGELLYFPVNPRITVTKNENARILK
jgi:hypothetical protein